MVKRFIVKLILFSLPFVFALGLFLYFEPFDYFGIHGDLRGFSEQNPIPRIRYFVNHPNSKSIVLGDSRTRTLSVETMKQHAKNDVANLAFGGAALNESIDLFWVAAGERKLENVYFQLSFYTMNKAYSHDRVETASFLANDFVSYLKNYEIQKKTWLEKRSVQENSAAPATKESLLEYADIILKNTAGYALNQDNIDALIAIAEYCAENKIRLVFYVPPVHRTIWDLVIYPQNLEQYLDSYKIQLSYYAPVLDMEYDSEISNKTEDYKDGFHFKGEVLELYLSAIFSGKGEYLRIWENGVYAPAA